MPTYEYRCKNCKTEFEIALTLKEKEEKSPKLKCPECNGTELSQLLSTSGILKHGRTKSCDPSPACGGCCHNGQCNH